MNSNRPFPFMAFLPQRLVCDVATVGPVGYWGKAPGTNGSVVGVILYTLVFHHLHPLAYALLLLLLLWLSVAFCDEAERRMRKQDPGEVIIDEVVAMPVCFIGLQPLIAQLQHNAWVVLLLGFALFRLFDILKPLGISRLQNLPGGWGVAADDIAAAIATCICLQLLAQPLLRYLAPAVSAG